jgi:hypothetical protein
MEALDSAPKTFLPQVQRRRNLNQSTCSNFRTKARRQRPRRDILAACKIQSTSHRCFVVLYKDYKSSWLVGETSEMDGLYRRKC